MFIHKVRFTYIFSNCGMKKKNTSTETANDPKSKINASLKVWGCRC